MRITSVATAILVTLGGLSLAWAQTPAQTAPTPAAYPSADDVAALADSRMAALKAGLKIKPDQEKTWANFETTIRDLAKQRSERMSELIKETQKTSPPAIVNPADVLRLRAKSLTQTVADIGKYADAIDPLFKTLDDGQKRRLLVLLAGR